MSSNLHNYRKSYEKGILTIDSVADDPMMQFEQWFKEAEASNTVDEVNAFTLSTLDANGYPRGRVVLLKEYSENGFIFYTNYNSEKGKAIEKHPQVCISFFWPALERQVIIKGTAEKTSEETSIRYFNSRPRASQLGALVSEQSEPIENREVLESKLASLEKKYEGQPIPKPKNWGGYQIRPVVYEFWQGRKNRLHDRVQYTKQSDTWHLQRLQP